MGSTSSSLLSATTSSVLLVTLGRDVGPDLLLGLESHSRQVMGVGLVPHGSGWNHDTIRKHR